MGISDFIGFRLFQARLMPRSVDLIRTRSSMNRTFPKWKLPPADRLSGLIEIQIGELFSRKNRNQFSLFSQQLQRQLRLRRVSLKWVFFVVYAYNVRKTSPQPHMRALPPSSVPAKPAWRERDSLGRLTSSSGRREKRARESLHSSWFNSLHALSKHLHVLNFSEALLHSSRSFHFVIPARFSIFHSSIPVFRGASCKHVYGIFHLNFNHCNEQPLESQIEITTTTSAKRDLKSRVCVGIATIIMNFIALWCSNKSITLQHVTSARRPWTVLNWILADTSVGHWIVGNGFASIPCSLRRECINKLISNFYCLSFRFALCVHCLLLSPSPTVVLLRTAKRSLCRLWIFFPVNELLLTFGA